MDSDCGYVSESADGLVSDYEGCAELYGGWCGRTEAVEWWEAVGAASWCCWIFVLGDAEG